MFVQQPLVITRPDRSVNIISSRPLNITSPAGHTFQVFGKNSANLNIQNVSQSQIPRSQSQGNFLIPRQPVVHVFVCDNANTKVKMLTDNFTTMLINNGIKVYTEKFMTHYPGYQVRAASFNTQADFFFQIHSKTAGPGHVRLYLNGQPKRMTVEEAISSIWSCWRLKCGALTKEEVDLLSNERILNCLHMFADIDASNFNLDDVQKQARKCIDDALDVQPLLDRLNVMENNLLNGRVMVLNAKQMSSDWNIEQGVSLQKCTQLPTTIGLSPPLKDLLLMVIDQTIQKLHSIQIILEKHYVDNKSNIAYNQNLNDETMNEIPIDTEQRIGNDNTLWEMMVESIDDDHTGSMRIASYGDALYSSERILTPVLRLEDY